MKCWHPVVGDELMVTANPTESKRTGRSYFTGNVDVNVREIERFYEMCPEGSVVLDNQLDTVTSWSVKRVYETMHDGRKWYHVKKRRFPFFLIFSREL